jgi:hypothetical protein
LGTSRFIGQVVSATEQVKLGEDRSPEPKPDADAEVSAWFDAACSASRIKALILASGLGVKESYLSEMRSGKRSVPLRSLRVFRANKEAVRAFVEALLEDLAPDEFELREKEALTEDEAEDDIAEIALEEEALREVLIRKAAKRSGRSVEAYQRALGIVP